MYSLRQLFRDGTLHAFDYPEYARSTFGITKIDVWDGGYPKDRKSDPEFFEELRRRADSAGCEIFLVMAGAIDAKGKTAEIRKSQADKFRPYVDQAVVLGAKYVRVFFEGTGHRSLCCTVGVHRNSSTARGLCPKQRRHHRHRTRRVRVG